MVVGCWMEWRNKGRPTTRACVLCHASFSAPLACSHYHQRWFVVAGSRCHRSSTSCGSHCTSSNSRSYAQECVEAVLSVGASRPVLAVSRGQGVLRMACATMCKPIMVAACSIRKQTRLRSRRCCHWRICLKHKSNPVRSERLLPVCCGRALSHSLSHTLSCD
jgi:hypothetical protein